MEIIPITFRAACAFVAEHHRHHQKPAGMKYALGLESEGTLVGVLIASRPVARALDDGRTVEVVRTCTDGTRNANSMLYGAGWRVAKAMGYLRSYSYTQEGESGASLRAAGYRLDAELPARGSWAESSVRLREIRHPEGTGGVPRRRWIIP